MSKNRVKIRIYERGTANQPALPAPWVAQLVDMFEANTPLILSDVHDLLLILPYV